MSSHPNRAHAQIIRVKGGRYAVKIVNEDNSIVWARRERSSGQIIYDRPERVPRLMKREIVPNLFKQIDRIKFADAKPAPAAQ